MECVITIVIIIIIIILSSALQLGSETEKSCVVNVPWLRIGLSKKWGGKAKMGGQYLTD